MGRPRRRPWPSSKSLGPSEDLGGRRAEESLALLEEPRPFSC